MFCSKCGTKNAKGAKFCKSCGEKIKEAVKTSKTNETKSWYIHDAISKGVQRAPKLQK